MTLRFRDRPFAARQREAQAIMGKYPDRIPVICERADPTNSDVPDIDKHKYLVPHDLTVGQFVYVIRKRLQLNPTKAIFLFVCSTALMADRHILPPVSALMKQVYEEHARSDGFLYIVYSGENTFG